MVSETQSMCREVDAAEMPRHPFEDWGVALLTVRTTLGLDAKKAPKPTTTKPTTTKPTTTKPTMPHASRHSRPCTRCHLFVFGSNACSRSQALSPDLHKQPSRSLCPGVKLVSHALQLQVQAFHHSCSQSPFASAHDAIPNITTSMQSNKLAPRKRKI
jgi:hypothetical protein